MAGTCDPRELGQGGDDEEDATPVVYEPEEPPCPGVVNVCGADNAVLNFYRLGSQDVCVPANVRAQMDAELNHNATIFQTTEGYKACLKTLKTYGSVVISANPGDGKTMVASGIARHLRDVGWGGTKCTPLVIKYPEEWRKYVNPDGEEDQLVLIEDMFGSHNLSTNMLNKWLTALSTIEACLENYGGRVFVIITCRRTVLAEARDDVIKFDLFDPRRVVNLSAEENLTPDDMKRLIVSHKDRARVRLTDHQIEQIVRTGMRQGFPRTCRLLVRYGADPDNLIEQFQHPTDILTTELRTLFKHREKKLLLYLLMLCNGKLDISERIPSQVVSNLLQTVLKELGMNPSVTFVSLIECIDSIPDSYVTVDEENRRMLIFSHPSVLCAVARLFSEENARCLIKHCHIGLLSDLIRLHKDGKKDTSTAIIVKESDIESLIDRFIEELLQGNYSQVCSHDALCNNRFVNRLVDVARTKNKLRQLLDKRVKLINWSVWNKRGALCQLILQLINESKVKVKDIDRLSAIIGAINTGNVEALKLLLETFTGKALKKCFDNQKQTNGKQDDGFKTLLGTACKSKKEEVVNLILNHQREELDSRDIKRLLTTLSSMHYCDTFLHLIGSLPIDILRASASLITLPITFKGHIARIVKFMCQQGADASITVTTVSYCVTVKEWKPFAKFTEVNFQELHQSAFSVRLTPRLNLYARKKEGYNPEIELHNMVAKGHVEIVELMLLLGTGANVNVPCDEGIMTPLHVAIEKGNKEMVSLLARYADVNIVSGRFGSPPLILALEKGDKEIVSTLLQQDDIEVNKKRESNGDTPLSVACSSLNVDFIKSLVKTGADVNLESGLEEKVTPLLKTCAIWNSSEVVQILVDYGADINSASRHRHHLPVQVAYVNDNKDAVRYFLANKAELPKGLDGVHTLLNSACRKRDTDMAKLFIESGENVNTTSGPDNESPLLIACSKGDSAMVQLLVEKGADVGLASGLHGFTPLHEAVRSGISNTVHILMQAGANVNEYEKMKGLTPLYVACQSGGRLVDVLLEQGADVNIPNGKDGDTVMHLATSNGDTSLMRKLIAKGAYVNMKGRKSKETPLYIACKNGDLESAKVLVGAEADVNEKNGENRESALYVACKSEAVQVVEFLLQNKADTDSINGLQNETALLHLCHCSQGDQQDARLRHVSHHQNVHEMVRLLMAYGADVNKAGGPDFSTPLQIAGAKSDAKLTLILRGVDVTPASHRITPVKKDAL